MAFFRKASAVRRLLPLALLAGLALAAAAMSLDTGTGALPASIRAQFSLCHEGGGTNCVVDGDTVWITGRKVRIAGIDAPETHEPKCAAEGELGRRAASRLQALLSSGTVTAFPADRNRDPNGRLLRNIKVDGRDAGETLIAEGLARKYGGRKRGWCG